MNEGILRWYPTTNVNFSLVSVIVLHQQQQAIGLAVTVRSVFSVIAI